MRIELTSDYTYSWRAYGVGAPLPRSPILNSFDQKSRKLCLDAVGIEKEHDAHLVRDSRARQLFAAKVVNRVDGGRSLGPRDIARRRSQRNHKVPTELLGRWC